MGEPPGRGKVPSLAGREAGATSMRMRLACPAQPARTRLAGAGRLRSVARHARSEHGKAFRQFRRAAVRTGCSLPLGRAHEDFAVLVALLAMKFVNRHGEE